MSSNGLSRKVRCYFMNVYRITKPRRGSPPPDEVSLITDVRNAAVLYSEKQKKELKGKRVLLIDEYVAWSNTKIRATHYLRTLTGEKGNVIFMAFRNRKTHGLSGPPSWYADSSSGLSETKNGFVKVDKASREIAVKVRRVLSEFANVLAAILKKQGY